ncbi:hypothetical protein LTR56_017217 [Elasticomyces elasticus]|nr:hypothetical protein LTR56_017217 [Elasticomyces elasticus]KAK3644884.1 hypothetical protein LTR22_015030 [Elasticomyces elasticus]KAK4923353.1 hypothetical protein LTR49_009423 [Elasticomyces elasticus]KAK5751163.1 hypothetical protein LTS12_018797 [Elasticomyces elasticus]
MSETQHEQTASAMPEPTAIELLRTQVGSDLEIYKAEKKRFYKLRDLGEDNVTETDRNFIINWSRASIRDYSERLEQLEDLDDPTVEQKEVMQLLNQLIMLGDEIGNIMAAFVSSQGPKASIPALSQKAPAAAAAPTPPKPATPLQEPKSSVPAQSQEVPAAAVAPALPKPATPSTLSADPIPPEYPATPAETTTFESPMPSASVQDEALPAQQSEPDSEASAELGVDDEGTSINPKDPKGVYAVLGISPDASWGVLRKAIRMKQQTCHPDRNPDPIAATEFAIFMALIEETVKTEEKRQAYDNIKSVDELQQLNYRVKRLAMSAAMGL